MRFERILARTWTAFFARPEEQIMWQLHAAFRLGNYRTPELDVTPALGVTLIVAVVGMIIHTGL